MNCAFARVRACAANGGYGTSSHVVQACRARCLAQSCGHGAGDRGFCCALVDYQHLTLLRYLSRPQHDGPENDVRGDVGDEARRARCVGCVLG